MKLLKWGGIILLIIMLTSFACVKMISTDLPKGTTGQEAEALAQDMLTALNKPAWDQLRYLRWSFFGGKHHYHWDKLNNIAIIEWKDNKVVMNLDQVNGRAYANGVEQQGEDKQKLIDKAWGFWCNDSFWFCAPFKIMDKGVSRSIVEKEGKKGLLVSYESGGVTPGDSYLWWLDDNNIPSSWQMWTKVLPVKGIENTWEEWVSLGNGAKISTAHGGGLPMKVKLSNVAGGMNLQDIGLSDAKAFDL